jgi:flagellar motor switch protein FliM
MNLDVGDILAFDYPVERGIDLLVNGKRKYRGHIVSSGRKLAMTVDQLCRPVE